MKKIIIFFVSWRLFITLGMILGLTLPVNIAFLGGSAKNYYISPLTWAWANFDGVHYWTIASVGYQQFQQAFFPLYPILMRLLGGQLQLNFVYSGIIISNLCFALGIYFLYKLANLDYKKELVVWSLVFLLVFPTSFYFGSVYTESLFFMLCVTSFYAARKNIWWLAGILGGLASATRIVGVFLLPALIIEYYKTGKSKLSVFFLSLIPAGLLIYMYWLKLNYNDPLYFYHVQSAFGANRSSSNIILLPQVIFRYFKIFITARVNYEYMVSMVEFVFSLIFFGLCVLAYKKMRLSYVLFSFFVLITPTLTGSLSSMPRYVLSAFPLFFLIPALIQRNSWRYFIVFTSSVLLLIATMLFTRGYWIA